MAAPNAAHFIISNYLSYLEYHLVFNLPAIAVLAWVVRNRLRRAHLLWIGVICMVAVAFTFPWDNWAVGQGIWGFGEGRVIARIANLPVEEVAFFVLEVIVVSLITVLFLPRPDPRSADG